jgi:hypothetical protein
MKGLLVPIFSSKPRRVLKSGVAPALLATTSVAALLLATPARAGQAITTPQASVTNPAGHATTSIVITGTTVTGAVTNAGTITPGTGIVFGRDAALIGAGFSMELSPDAKVFVDYDGRVGSRLQEHSFSGGLRVRF